MTTQTSKKSPRTAMISRIWCLARDLGLDGNNKEMFYLVIESVTGSTSISSLSAAELKSVIYHLQAELHKVKHKKYRENSAAAANGVTYLPTPEQRELVSGLMRQIQTAANIQYPDRYLNSICQRTFQREYRHLNRHQVQSLIEALKSIQKRHLSGGSHV